MRRHVAAVAAIAASLFALGAPAGASDAPAPTGATFIHEFPHPQVVAHYHPRAGQQFTIRDVRYALQAGCHGLELDLHMRDGEVVCNHDGPTPAAPRLADALRLIVRYMDGSTTVHRDGRQFFLVIEPKDDDPALFEATANVLAPFSPYLSTAVGPTDAPRGLTVVMTGAHLAKVAERFRDRPARLNRLCILENRDYSGEIVSRAKGAPRFQWTALPYPRHQGRVPALHEGTDPGLKGRFNIRVWAGNGHLDELLASSVDSINVDHEEAPAFAAHVRALTTP